MFKTNNSRFLLFLIYLLAIVPSIAHAQEDNNVEKQFWAMVLLNYRLNEKWTYNQDFGYQHLYASPTFTRLLTRSQLNRQFTGVLSLHGGLILTYKFNEIDNNAYEIRPWLGVKARWPSFWRFDFLNYLRFEQGFEHTVGINDWNNNFRVRYKIGSSVPINHNSLIDNTFYTSIAYEFYSQSFANDVRWTTAATHRFDLGLGFRQNVKNRYEALLVVLNGRDDVTGEYSLSSVVFFLRYHRYINWE